MPITHYHFGPGLLIKGFCPSAMSLTAFVLANVVIDIEVVVRLLAGVTPLHSTLHTFWVAIPVGLLSGGVVYGFGLFIDKPRETWNVRPALLGGFLGGLSQPLLDGIMHMDIRPFWPVSDANPMLRLVDLQMLHASCAIAGVVGGGLLLLNWWWTMKSA